MYICTLLVMYICQLLVMYICRPRTMSKHEVYIFDCCNLQVGNPGLTVNEQRAHFALWALLKSPLFIGADLRTLSREAKEILTAPEVIAVNQDPLGVAGDLIWKQGPLEVGHLCFLVDASWLMQYDIRYAEGSFVAISCRCK